MAEAEPKSQTSRKNKNLKTMKKLFVTITATLFALTLMGKDVVTLNNQMKFDGKVLRIKECEVLFKASGQKYVIPAVDILSIEFEDANDRVYRNYLEMLESNPDLCLKGQFDADNYHGKEAGHFFLGLLFGPFAMIGTAVSNPTPDRGRRTYMMSQNKELFSDPAFLSCYKKKAKGKLIGMEAAGWATWILILLL